MNEFDRAFMVAALESVDAVCVFDDDTPVELISEIVPDVLVKGADYTLEEVVGREIVENAGGRVGLIPLHKDYSSTNLIIRIREAYE
jgi:rfaE bifunctional protein nucleotidyltransferase chain/domain